MSTFNIHDNKKVVVNNNEAPKESSGFKKCADCDSKNCAAYGFCANDEFKKLNHLYERNRLRLFQAAMANDVVTLKKFLKEIPIDYPDIWGNTALLFATIVEATDCMRELVAAGANPAKLNRKGSSALQVAAQNLTLLKILENTHG